MMTGENAPMGPFYYCAPTQIVFGCGRVAEIGQLARPYGERALLVTTPAFPAVEGLYAKVKASLQNAGMALAHFDGVIPNPTTEVVSAGAAMAKAFGAQVVIGLGGGSSMDTAKAIAVEASHPGGAWDYLHNTPGPTEKTLPILAVGTTAGTGSQTSPCAVVTNPRTQDKSAIWHKNIFPKIALVDPEATATMPPTVTAQTGFDAFCHCFEAYLSVNTNPMAELLALDGMRRAIRFLPRAVKDGGDMQARAQMCWADTLGGLANASAGVTLPHGLGMQVGGHCPQVSHGQALAIVYPEFTRFTWQSSIQKFARVGRIFDPALSRETDEAAAKACCAAIDALLKDIGLWMGFADVGVPAGALRRIADRGQVLPDYRNNPRLASTEEMYQLLVRCYRRG